MNNTFKPKEYWENRLTETYDLSGTGFAGLGLSYNKWVYRVRKRVFSRIIYKNIVDVSTQRVLDIGSGTGFYLDLWEKAGAISIFGSDLTSVAVMHLKKKYPDMHIVQLDIGSGLPSELQTSKFDIISAFDVLFHIVNDEAFEKAISNIASLLSPKGLFIFSDNFLHGDTVRFQHQVNRGLSSIEEIVIRNNFEIIERIPMSVIMNYPIDTNLVFLQKIWKYILAPARKFEFYGNIAGAVMYPIELLLTRFIQESPTTELMICRKH